MRWARRTLARNAPTISSLLGLAERRWSIRWMRDGSDAAHCHSGPGVICINWSWFRTHPDDEGCLSHEYTHLLQDVPGGTCPPQIVEGIADAVRFLLGQYDASWWSPSPWASRIAALPRPSFRALARLMAEGRYGDFLWP
jgi:Peptidase of plants and bacteria